MISSSKRLLYFPPYIFLFIFFFLYFSLTFAPSLPLHASICQQTIPRRFRPVLSLLFVVSFSNSISEFSWDSVDFFCFFFLFVLEGLVYFWFSLLLCWSWPRLPRGSSQTFWSRDEDGLTGASHCCGLMLLPRLVLRQRSPGENGRLGNQAWNIFCFLLLFFWIQPRHW